MPENRTVLPKDTKPERYHIDLTPDFTTFKFLGKETVHFDVLQETSQVTLNCLEIDVKTAEVEYNGQKHGASEVILNKEEETLTLKFSETFKPSTKGVLHLTFEGTLNDNMAGFYRSKAVIDGVEKYTATTQFEPTDARKAFPCYDEPSLKATFVVTLRVPKDMVALSNMPPVEEKTEGDLKVVTFDETPIMSTYLLAYVVGYFESIEDKTPDGVTVRVFTLPGKTDQGKFALDVAVRTLTFFTEYFDIPYPLPKADMISIPDFSAGAMENWGLITYRETALLYDEANSSLASKKRVAEVVAHELAHQWFGNLVTMEWWSDLWLNEGFATWVGTLAVDHLFKNWDIWVNFAFQYWNSALKLDALQSSHAIEVEINHARQVSEIFDHISYFKGSSVIRMLSTYLGEEDFRNGLREYLKRHKYGNARTADLWSALSDVSGKPVNEIMSNWTFKMGYPYVKVEAAGDKLELSQSRFLADGSDTDDLWYIPVDAVSKGNPSGTSVDLKTKSTSLTGVGDGWVKVNAGQAGFYRVSYSSELLHRLSTAIAAKELSAVDRLGIQADLFALAKSGKSSTHFALETSLAYSNEEDFTVWSDLITNIVDVQSVWKYDESVSDNFKAYMRKLLSPSYERLGWDSADGETDLQKMLRPIVISTLGHSGDQRVIAEAKKRFTQHCNGEADAPPDLRFAIYSLSIKNGGEEEFESLYKVFKETDLHEEKLRALRGLSNTADAALRQRVLEMSTNPAEVRSQDIMYPLMELAKTVEGNQLVWDYVTSNWSKVVELVGSAGFLIQRVVKIAAAGFASEEKAKEVEKFFADHPIDSAKRTIEQSLEAIRLHAQWLERDREHVSKYLATVA